MKSLTDTQRELITPELMGYADTLAKRFDHRGIPLADLQQEAYYGLCLAALHYDASKEVLFKTFSHFYIMRTLVNAFNTYENIMHVPPSERPYIHLLSLDIALSDDGDDGSDYLSDDATPEPFDIVDPDTEDEEQSTPNVEPLLAVLTRQERRAIQSLFGIDQPQLTRKETARLLKVTPERIRILYNKALAKMSLTPNP